MTEKRFKKVVYGEEDECGRAWKIVDNATDKEYTKPYMIVDCMNELADENEQLKKEGANVERLIDDLGSEELRRQYEEIINGDKV